ncbi:hypothetical protein AB0I00_09615 [Streptomyces sp. NPDC050803]|uniref:hypothetical protein n=1 Tax=unclassified Streptomyces TaxID=2593676 RepID=UPI00341B7872
MTNLANHTIALSLDRTLQAGPVHCPVQIRAGDAAWNELGRVTAQLAAESFVIYVDEGVPRPHAAQVLQQLGLSAPTHVVRDPATAPITPDSVVVGLGGTRAMEGAARLAGPGSRPLLLPTTLTAMTDTALTLVGRDSAPRLVRAHLDTLRTLPPAAVRAGLAALVRGVLAVSPAFYDTVASRLVPEASYDLATLASFVALSVEIRSTLTVYDPLEQGAAAALRYGDPVTRALRALGHRDAAAVGLAVAARIAVRAGLLDADAERAHRELIGRWGARTTLPASLGADAARDATGLRPVGMVLLDGLGRPHVTRSGPLTEVAPELLAEELAAAGALPRARSGEMRVPADRDNGSRGDAIRPGHGRNTGLMRPGRRDAEREKGAKAPQRT